MKFLIILLALTATVFAEEHDAEYEKKRLALQNPDLYDGDMAGIDGPFDAERNAIPGNNYRWPNAEVPYVIDNSLSRATGLIEAAFNHYHQYTCVRFKPRTNEWNYVRLFYGQGCYSHVGRTGGQQPLSLGDGCLFIGTVIHELGHALGFYHEQNRSDRDNYLYIYLQNVHENMQFNFAKLGPNQNILYNNFDYNSIMIYGNQAFSKNGYNTIEAKNGQRLYEPFDKNTMTWADIERVNKMYGCRM